MLVKTDKFGRIRNQGKAIVSYITSHRFNYSGKDSQNTEKIGFGRSLTITLVTDTFNMHNNGITISAMRLAENLSAQGHKIRVITCGDPEKCGIDNKTGLDMYYVNELKIPLATKLAHKQDSMLGSPDKTTIKRALAGSDLVHIFQFWPMDNMARKMARKLNIPAIAAFHIQPENITYNIGLGWFKPAVHIAYFIMKISFYSKFNHIHCPSRFIAAQLRSHGYKAWLHVVSNGVHPSFRQKEPNRNYNLTDSTLEDSTDDFSASVSKKINSDNCNRIYKILMIGRLSPEKRQDVLIKALKHSKYGSQIQLYFAGTGPCKDKLLRLGSKLDNPPIFGYYTQEDLIKLIQGCDLYVHASDIEIEGVACLEALTCGLVPIIANSKRSATTQFALDSTSLFKAGNPKNLAEKIDYWLDQPELRKSTGESYASIGKTYYIDNCVRQMEKIYRKLPRNNRNIYHRSKIFKLFSRIFYTVIAIPVLYLWTRVILGVRIVGRKNLRNLSGALTLCNHVHFLDSALVSLVLFPRKIIFPTISKNLDSIWPGKIVQLLGGIAIPGNLTDLKDFMHEMELLLANGRVIHFFPEGELEPYSTKLREFKKGAFYLASQARVPLVPMLIGFRKPRGIYRLFYRKPTMTLHVGEPIYPLPTDSQDDLKLRMDIAQEQMNSFAESYSVNAK